MKAATKAPALDEQVLEPAWSGACPDRRDPAPPGTPSTPPPRRRHRACLAHLFRRGVRREFGSDAALVERDDAVGQRVDLVELGRDQQHRPALGLLLQDLRQTNSIAPTSRPRVGCAATKSFGIGLELAGQDQLLLVAARQGSGGHVDASRPHVETLDESGGKLLDLLDEQEAAGAAELVIVLTPQDRVLPQRHVQHQTLLVPVLGDERDPRVADAAPCSGRPDPGRPR